MAMPQLRRVNAVSIRRALRRIRGHTVMLDSDLAGLYCVDVKVLNQAVKRNRSRFPLDFMFQMTTGSRGFAVTICDRKTW